MISAHVGRQAAVVVHVLRLVEHSCRMHHNMVHAYGSCMRVFISGASFHHVWWVHCLIAGLAMELAR